MGGGPPEDPGQGRLLPGEGSSINTGDEQTIRHWLEVYRQLYDFKEHLLQEIEEQGQHVAPPGQAELDNDRKMLEREAARVQDRIKFWEQALRRQSGD